MKITVSSLKDLLEIVDFFVNGSGVPNLYDMIVLEGSECVGKTTLLDLLSGKFGWNTYRPDYSFWKDVSLPRKFRWSIFMSLIDFATSGSLIFRTPLLIDRGMMSGLVYNFPEDLREYYLKLFETKIYNSTLKVLYIVLSPVNQDTHIKMIESRGTEISPEEITKILKIDKEFQDLVSLSSLSDIITYRIQLNDEIDNRYCEACGHYFSGICLNPNSSHYKGEVRGNLRCEYTNNKEVQDV